MRLVCERWQGSGDKGASRVTAAVKDSRRAVVAKQTGFPGAAGKVSAWTPPATRGSRLRAVGAPPPPVRGARWDDAGRRIRGGDESRGSGRGCRRMRSRGWGVRRGAVRLAAAVCGALVMSLAACGGLGRRERRSQGRHGRHEVRARTERFRGAQPADPTRIPDVGRPSCRSRSPPSLVRSWRSTARARTPPTPRSCCTPSSGATWRRTRSWEAHNGKKGWTTDHREGDKRSPVGVFTLTDAGGVLRRPGCQAPVQPSRRRSGAALLAEDALARLRLRHRHRLQPRQGHFADRPHAPAGPVEGRQHLAAHGPRQRHLGLCEPVQVGHGVPAAHPGPGKHPVVVMGDKAALAAR